MNTWTPGPWSVTDDGENVAQSGSAGFHVEAWGNGFPPRPGDMALIAAAPELFDALDRLHAWAVTHGAPHDLLAPALNVIRKVEGP